MKKMFFCFVIIFAIFGVVFLPASEAEVDEYGFDDSLRYDVYFAAEDSELVVLSNVKVEGVKNWGGKTYLSVSSYGLKLTEADGFVLLDSIVAILPDGNFNIKNISGAKFN